MSDVNVLVANLLSNDNDLRRAAEAELGNRRDADPEGTMGFLLQACTHSDPSVRNMSTILVKRSLMGVWNKLTDDLKNHYRESMINLTAAEEVKVIRSQVEIIVCEIASEDVPLGKWTDLFPKLLALSSHSNPILRASALEIFAKVSITCQTLNRNSSLILEVFQNAVVDSDSRVVAKAVECVLGLSAEAEGKLLKGLREFIPGILQHLTMLTQHGEEEYLLCALESVEESGGRFFRHRLKNILELLIAICKQNSLDGRVIFSSLEAMMAVLENSSKKSIEALPDLRIFELLADWASKIEYDEEWATSDHVDTDSGTVRACGDGLPRYARVMDSVYGKQFTDKMQETVLQCVQSSDWKIVHAGLIILLYCAEHCSDMDCRLTAATNLVMNLISHPQPQIRVQALEVVTSFMTEFENYAKNFNLVLLQPTIKLLGDEVPRVRYTACTSISICYSEAPVGSVDPVLGMYVEQLLKIITNTNEHAFVRIEALEALGYITDSASATACNPHYSIILSTVSQVLTSNEPTVIVSALSCVGSLAVTCRESFVKDANSITDYLCKMHGQISSESDLRVGALLSTWVSVARALGDNFVPHLPKILPILIHRARITERPATDSEAYTAMEGDAKISLAQLRKVVSSVNLPAQCFEEVVTVGVGAAKYTHRAFIRLEGCKLLAACLGKDPTKANPNILAEYIRQSCDSLLVCSDCDDAVALVRTMTRVLEKFQIPTEGVVHFGKTFIQALRDSGERIDIEREGGYEDEDEDDEDTYNEVSKEELHFHKKVTMAIRATLFEQKCKELTPIYVPAFVEFAKSDYEGGPLCRTGLSWLLSCISLEMDIEQVAAAFLKLLEDSEHSVNLSTAGDGIIRLCKWFSNKGINNAATQSFAQQTFKLLSDRLQVRPTTNGGEPLCIETTAVINKLSQAMCNLTSISHPVLPIFQVLLPLLPLSVDEAEYGYADDSTVLEAEAYEEIHPVHRFFVECLSNAKSLGITLNSDIQAIGFGLCSSKYLTDKDTKRQLLMLAGQQ